MLKRPWKKRKENIWGKGSRTWALWGAIFLCIMLLGGCGRQQETGQVRVGSLKGPTSLGLLFLMDKSEKADTQDCSEIRSAAGADARLALMAKGELDIALVPANVAAAFWHRTDGGVSVIDVNTLGVLYLVTGDGEVECVEDLRGRTIYLTGRGTTPEAALRYILHENGFAEEDYALDFKSEAAEVAAVLAEKPEALGLLPQPFATAALMKNKSLRAALDMNEEWEKLSGGMGGMVTGVTIVRNEFLEEHEDAVREFLREHEESAAALNRDPETGAALAVQAGIVAGEEIALEAIPQCNVTCIQGKELREKLEGYLKVLAGFDQELIGGSLPEEAFYYVDPAGNRTQEQK